MHIIPDSEIDRILDKWKGLPCRLWDYTSTHSRVTLRITQLNGIDALHIDCIMSNYISGPTSWKSNDLTVFRSKDKDKDREYSIEDNSIGFVVRCSSVLLYFPDDSNNEVGF